MIFAITAFTRNIISHNYIVTNTLPLILKQYTYPAYGNRFVDSFNTCVRGLLNIFISVKVTSLMDFLGRRLASFFAAASIDSAAPNNSFSAIMVGSSGLTQSLPNVAIKHLINSDITNEKATGGCTFDNFRYRYQFGNILRNQTRNRL